MGPTPVVKLSQQIVFDGIPDEEAWNDVPPLPMVTLMPAFGKEPAESSIIKIPDRQKFVWEETR